MADPRRAPLGNGFAGRARSAILNRQRQIDDQVDAAMNDAPRLTIRPKKKKSKK